MLTATGVPLRQSKHARRLALFAVLAVFILGELALHLAKHRGWTTYTADDGLADSDLTAITVAPDGAVWVGTRRWTEYTWEGGISRFDGETWTTYTEGNGLVDDWVSAITVASDGTVWVGTRNGSVSCFDGETWTTYTEDDGLADYWVVAIAVAQDGAVWVAARGVSRFDGETWTTYTKEVGLADGNLTTVAVAPDGAVWVGTGIVAFSGTHWVGMGNDDVGVSRFDGETWITYTKDDGLADGDLTTIAVAADGAVWVGTSRWTGYTWEDSISRFDGETWTTYAKDGGLAGNDIYAIALAPDGALWVVTSGGVSRFDGETWVAYTPANSGLGNRMRYRLTVDSQGWVWLATRGGVQVFDDRVSFPQQVMQVWALVWHVLRILLAGLALAWISELGVYVVLGAEAVRLRLQAPPGRAFRRLWVLASAAGWAVASAAISGLGWIWYGLVGETAAAILTVGTCGAIGGAVAGAIQRPVLRTQGLPIDSWVWVTTLSWSVGFLQFAGWGEIGIMGALMCFAGSPASGICQWLVLRRHIPKAGRWLVASAIGFWIGGVGYLFPIGAVFAVSNAADQIPGLADLVSPYPFAILVMAILGAIAGLCWGQSPGRRWCGCCDITPRERQVRGNRQRSHNTGKCAQVQMGLRRRLLATRCLANGPGAHLPTSPPPGARLPGRGRAGLDPRETEAHRPERDGRRWR